MTITESEINGDAELDLAASKDVLQKAVSLMKVEVLKANCLIATPTCELMLKLVFTELCHVEAAVAQVDMLATFLRLKEFKSNLSLWVLIGQFGGEN